MSEARIGPHEVKRTLVVGPGLELAEAADSSGRKLLLQILRLRSPRNEELDLLRGIERGVAKVTTALFDAFSISTHAGIDAPDGTRVLFWTLPWPGQAFFDLTRGRRLSEAETLETARMLIERARRLQGLGVHDPALYEGALLVTSAGVPFDVAGVPVCVPRRWLQRLEPAPRWLPEEEDGAFTAEGDLFRISAVLSAISAPSALSMETRALLAKLADRAYPDFGSALASVRRLQESLLEASGLSRKSEPVPSRPMAPAVLPPPSQAPEGPDWGAMFGDLEDPEVPFGDDVTEPPLSVPELAESALPLRAPAATPPALTPAPPANGPRATPGPIPAVVPSTPRPGPAVAGPGPAISAMMHARTPTPLPAANPGSTPGLAARSPRPPSFTDEEPVWADADLLSDPSGRPVPIRTEDALFDLPIEMPSPSADLELEPGLVAAEPPVAPLPKAVAPVVHGDPGAVSSSVVQALAVQKAAWAAPVFAEGASPWSEIVETQGAHRRARGGFPGYEESLPGVVPEALLPTSPGLAPVSPPPIVTSVAVANPVRPVEVAPAAPPVVPVAGPSSGAPRVVAGVVAILVVFGAVAALMRGLPEPIDALDGLVASPTNTVELDSEPSGAKVVAEADGRLLGRTPMSFLVPTGANAAVLVVARGYEPQRVALPDRGALELRLTPLSRDAGCEIELVAPEGLRLEGLETEIGDAGLAQVPGSMVVRAAEEQAFAGARLVRCPELGGRTRQELRFDKRWAPATLRVSAPEGANVFVDGESVGPVPASHKTSASFAAVRVVDAQARAVERWVPTRTETEVQMPGPASRVVDVRAGELPDDQGEAGESEEPTPIEPILEETVTRPPTVRGRRLSRADRDRVGNLLREGNRLLLSGQVPKAQLAFETCLKIDESTAACHRSLGTLHRRQNDEKGARKHLSRYVELAPDAPDVPTIRRILKTLD